MAVSPEVKERIIAAANALYERSPTGEYPTVEAVRQESRAAMSTVVEVMKGWRESQRKQVQVVREPLPLPLQEHVRALGQSFWTAKPLCWTGRCLSARSRASRRDGYRSSRLQHSVQPRCCWRDSDRPPHACSMRVQRLGAKRRSCWSCVLVRR